MSAQIRIERLASECLAMGRGGVPSVWGGGGMRDERVGNWGRGEGGVGRENKDERGGKEWGGMKGEEICIRDVKRGKR